jgi:hypothetical protein
LVPKEKKSACWASRSAVSAARGTSIIVPMLGFTFARGHSACTAAISCSTRARSRSSSRTWVMSGSMISGWMRTPSVATSHAASMIARTCMR